MPALDSPAVIVARFLKTNGYLESYDAFIAESGLPADAGNVQAGRLTLEQLLEEKKAFDYSLNFEQLDLNVDSSQGWSKPAPGVSSEIKLPASANIISLEGAEFSHRTEVMVTTADRSLHVVSPVESTVRDTFGAISDSPILCSLVFSKDRVLASSMSGQLVVSDLAGHPLETRKDHTKYVTKIAVLEDPTQPIIATSGWDNKISIYHPQESSFQGRRLGPPISTLTLPTKPEALLLTHHPSSNQPLLILTRSNSTYLHYYTPLEAPPRLLGRQNLAPHSNAWVAFTPSAIALSPTDPTLLAVATSTIPHLKLIVVRMLVPSYDAQPSVVAEESQASQARAELAVADEEQAAIQIHCTTMAPQTPYSTPAVVWRPDGSGVWVNGDDGAVRGVEARSGKVVATLKGHEAGSKVRCLWSGRVDFGRQGHGAEEEVLFSGGFDQKLLMWRVER